MKKFRIEPMPSPTGRNDERLWIVRAPYGTDPRGALDSAMRRAKDRKYGRDDDPDQDRNLGELRRKLEHMLSQCLKGEQYSAAMDLMDEAGLPGGQTYGEVDGRDSDPDETAESLWSKFPDHIADGVRKYLADQGYSDDDIEAVMPKSAMAGGMGGEAGDRRGRARDRRGAMDRSMSAAESFEAFYGTSRIKHAT
jgi:hypothetical protein